VAYGRGEEQTASRRYFVGFGQHPGISGYMEQVSLAMSETIVSKVGNFLLGVGIGSLIGMLFAPNSGRETRDSLAQRARERSEYTKQRTTEVREGAQDLFERGKEVVTQKKKQIRAAVDAGRETYWREKSKAGTG
jgi:gas vesicle protein